MTDGRGVRLEVVRDDLHRTRVVEEPVAAADDGEAVVRVDAFGLTANNISYAVFGDMLGYWRFFPSEGEWGQVPAWGFATVVDSAADALAEGDRLFGYLPMADHLRLRPRPGGAGQVVDASEHRAGLPPAYNTYRRVDADPLYDADHEDAQMVLWPLFFTGLVLDGFLGEQHCFGARAVVLSSASSKTAIATAFCLARRGGVGVVGLTSPGHVERLRSLGLYDRVVAYDDIAGLAVQPAVYVDFAGDTEVRAAVHRRYGDALAHSALVGGTHWDRSGPGEVPGIEPQFFFAPDHWGPQTEADLPDAWRAFAGDLGRWIRFERRSGIDAARAAFLDTLDGRVDPSVGLVLSI